MFEARLVQGKVFKQIIEAIKDLVQDANIDCSEEEVAIQSMDSSHVALVAVALQSSGFDHFRCDRSISLGFSSTNMAKILKCAGADDIITLKADDDGDTLTLMFESPGNERIADFGMYRTQQYNTRVLSLCVCVWLPMYSSPFFILYTLQNSN